MDRCIEGRLYRHQPFPDDPHFERDVGECPGCPDCKPPTRPKMRLVSENSTPTAKHLIELIARGEHTRAQIIEACQLWLRLQLPQADPLDLIQHERIRREHDGRGNDDRLELVFDRDEADKGCHVYLRKHEDCEHVWQEHDVYGENCTKCGAFR